MYNFENYEKMLGTILQDCRLLPADKNFMIYLLMKVEKDKTNSFYTEVTNQEVAEYFGVSTNVSRLPKHLERAGYIIIEKYVSANNKMRRRIIIDPHFIFGAKPNNYVNNNKDAVDDYSYLPFND